MVHRWIYKKQPDEELVSQLSGEINVNPVIGSILIQRKTDTFDKALS